MQAKVPRHMEPVTLQPEGVSVMRVTAVAVLSIMIRRLKPQEAREAARREAGALRGEVERVLTQHRERVAAWEADAARDEAALAQRAAAVEVLLPTLSTLPSGRVPCCPVLLHVCSAGAPPTYMQSLHVSRPSHKHDQVATLGSHVHWTETEVTEGGRPGSGMAKPILGA